MFATHSDGNGDGEDGDGEHGDGEYVDGEGGDHVNINSSLFCSLGMLSKPNRQLSGSALMTPMSSKPNQTVFERRFNFQHR